MCSTTDSLADWLANWPRREALSPPFPRSLSPCPSLAFSLSTSLSIPLFRSLSLSASLPGLVLLCYPRVLADGVTRVKDNSELWPNINICIRGMDAALSVTCMPACLPGCSLARTHACLHALSASRLPAWLSPSAPPLSEAKVSFRAGVAAGRNMSLKTQKRAGDEEDHEEDYDCHLFGS